MQKERNRGRIRKLAATIIVAVFLMMEIAGCGMKKEIKRAGMVPYMEKKYGEKFQLKESYAGQLGSEYAMSFVESCDQPEKKALVMWQERDGKDCYEDNYMAFLLQEELEKKIGALARTCFGECKIYYKIPYFVFPSDFTKEMTAEEFLQHPAALPMFFIYPIDKEGDRAMWEERMENFRQKNWEQGYLIRGTLSLALSEGDYEMINEENYLSLDYKGYQAKDELIFALREDGTYSFLRWL